MPVMRAKLKVTSVTSQGDSQRVTMSAVAKSGAYPEDGSDENNTFAKFSPQADFSITIANPALKDALKVGECYYADFTLAPQ